MTTQEHLVMSGRLPWQCWHNLVMYVITGHPDGGRSTEALLGGRLLLLNTAHTVELRGVTSYSCM